MFLSEYLAVFYDLCLAALYLPLLAVSEAAGRGAVFFRRSRAGFQFRGRRRCVSRKGMLHQTVKDVGGQLAARWLRSYR